MNYRIKSVLAAGIVFGVGGFILGGLAYVMAQGAQGEGYDIFPYAAGIGGLLTAALLWWLLLARPRNYSVSRGLGAGMLTGLLAHYPFWYAIIVYANICLASGSSCSSSFGKQEVNLLQGILAAGQLCLPSWIFFGWVTVLGGAMLGSVLAYIQNRKYEFEGEIQHAKRRI
ncbi:MAG: hypothetical protein HGA53_03150 [Anaerolineaceae bacterium]|nr:hypothetical protein [Anaerolineaceae bacterium]